MTDSSFSALIREREAAKGALSGKAVVPQDDAARPESYEAVRRIRSFHFFDVVFRSHRGAPRAFSWMHLRSWVGDETGQRMSFIWPEAIVILTGRHLELVEEDVMRRIVAEFRQVKPGCGDSIPPGIPVIQTMDVTAIDMGALPIDAQGPLRQQP